jgi:hypothetical protein
VNHYLSLILNIPDISFAEEDIKGFDGFSWGTPIQKVKEKVNIIDSKEIYDGRIIAVRAKLPPKIKLLGAKIEVKIYYFCKNYGLCAGQLRLLTSPGFSIYTHDTVFNNLTAVIGEKYGYFGSKQRETISHWVAPSGTIFIESSIKGKKITRLEIHYRSYKYYELMNEIDKSHVKKIKEANLIKGFKF